jgi:nicotinate phosphoribosyltransferase
MIASKAARIVEAAGGRSVVEFGSRRAHSPEAGVLAARAAYIGGCTGTSNTEAGYRFGIPVFGTSAHSWVLSFESEREAFAELQRLLGPSAAYLIDTYDTIEGARRAASLGRPMWGVRLDSGDLHELTWAVRRILDKAGMHEAKIMVSSDLNEYKILEFVAAGLPIDALGVGTDLATSADAPNVGVVYKLVELESGAGRRAVAKLSEDKLNYPGAKQVFRYPAHDVIGAAAECPSCEGEQSEALLRPVILRGELVEPLPTPQQAREHARACISRLPSLCRKLSRQEEPYRVEYSGKLEKLAEEVFREVREAVR